MRKKQGISLIVLVITIIVMIILAAAIIISLTNAGIINKASDAVTESDLKLIQQECEVVKMIEIGNYYSNTLHHAKLNKALLLTKLNEHFKGSTKSGDRIITSDGKYVIIVGDDLSINVGINIPGKKNNLTLTATYNSPVTEMPYTIYVTPVIEGWEKKDETTGVTYSSYEEYAAAILDTISEEELEQVFVDGYNYWNVENDWREPLYKNIDELVNTWSSIYDGNAYTTLEGMLELYECNSVAELALSFQAIKPEGYFGGFYIEYAREKIQDLTDSKEDVYMQGRLYLAERESWGNLTILKNAATFEEFVLADMQIEGITSFTALVDKYNEMCEFCTITEEDMLIILKTVYLMEYDELLESDLEDGQVLIKSSTGLDRKVMTGTTVEFYSAILGTVTFEAISYNGKKASASVTPIHSFEGEQAKLIDNYGDSTVAPTDASYFEYEFDDTNMTAKIVQVKSQYAEYSLYTNGRGEQKNFVVSMIDAAGNQLTDVILPYEVTVEGKGTYKITGLGQFFSFINSPYMTGTSKMTSIVVPNSITEIDVWAFARCAELKTLRLPAYLNTIAGALCQYCEGLTTVEFPLGVQIIEASAFYGCDNLTIVSLPTTVKEIESNAFQGGLTTVNYAGTKAQWESITKASNWTTGVITINCSDGSFTVGVNK